MAAVSGSRASEITCPPVLLSLVQRWACPVAIYSRRSGAPTSRFLLLLFSYFLCVLPRDLGASSRATSRFGPASFSCPGASRRVTRSPAPVTRPIDGVGLRNSRATERHRTNRTRLFSSLSVPTVFSSRLFARFLLQIQCKNVKISSQETISFLQLQESLL